MAETSVAPSIASLLANAAQTNADFDFNKINKAYFEGRDQFAKNDLRDAFRNGVPTTPDGQPDFAAMAKTLFQKGALDQGVSASNLDLERQKLKFGQAQSEGIRNFENGSQPQQSSPQQSIVSPPSVNRSASSVVAAPLNKGGESQQGQNLAAGRPQAPQATVMTVLAAQGIPNDQLQAASASVGRQLGVDPTEPLDVNDPQVRNVLVPAIQRLKSAGIGQVQPAQSGIDQPQEQPQAVVQQPQVAQASQAIPGPVTNSATTTNAQPVPSRNDQAIAYYAGIMSDPRSPKQNVDLAKARLEAIQKNSEFTPLQKEYAQAVSQGFKGTMRDFEAERESSKAASTEQAKSYVTKYNNIEEAGSRAIQEIPKLQLALQEMSDPNFYSGAGSNYNLALKRVAVALGGDPNKAAPQEIVQKVIADSVLNGLGALKGLGPIRVAEMNLANKAAMSSDNTPQTNRFLANVAIRLQQRAVEISDEAQNYNDGKLDAGFDRKIREMEKKKPLFTPEEISHFQRIIDNKDKAAFASQENTAASTPGAKQAPDGKFYIPDPNRPGKYLRVGD